MGAVVKLARDAACVWGAPSAQAPTAKLLSPRLEGVERLQEEPSASTAADEAAVSEPPASAATLQEMGMDFMDTGHRGPASDRREAVPLFCSVQLGACRKQCESCENPPSWARALEQILE